jgi:urease accessory protein
MPDPTNLPLLLWLSPAFPVGAFAYSHGLEWAAVAGDVVDAASLIAWLEDLCDSGGPRNDAVLFAAAWRAAAAEDWTRLAAINELAVALAGSLERRLETTQQGAAFVAAASAAWDSATLANFRIRVAEPISYPVAVAATAAGRGIALDAALPAFALAIFANLVSAAVRLSVIGQTDGQRTLAALLPRVAAMAEVAAGAELVQGEAALGGAAFRSDLAALRHETQYSRLFRS